MFPTIVSTLAALTIAMVLADPASATRDCNPRACAAAINACEIANGCDGFSSGMTRAACRTFCRRSVIEVCQEDAALCSGEPPTTSTTVTSTSTTTTTTAECQVQAAACGSCGGGSCRPHCGVSGEPLVCRGTIATANCLTDADCTAGEICTSDSGVCGPECAPGDCICTAPCP